MKRLLFLTVLCMGIAMFLASPVCAKVAGVCSNCHTMHNSQNGSHMMINTTIDGESGGTHGGGYPALTRGTCVGCHTGTNNGSNIIPYVYDNVGIPTYGPTGNTLAGGNFYWVAQTGGSAKGHNVKGVPDVIADAVLTKAPGDQAGGGTSCGTSSCHTTLFAPDAVGIGGGVLNTGCEGCHVAPKHHAPQQAAGAPALEANGYFRFLSSHINSANGVRGIEDADWQFDTTGSLNHNEYLGSTTNTNNTMTGYCTGCHGDFHNQLDGNDDWIRHPSDAVLPTTGEYAAYTAYDVIAPVARSALTAVSDLVTPGTDMVMCLSCHRAHGSPYDDLLRWEYDGMVAGGGGANDTGCFVCHTAKDE